MKLRGTTTSITARDILIKSLGHDGSIHNLCFGNGPYFSIYACAMADRQTDCAAINTPKLPKPAVPPPLHPVVLDQVQAQPRLVGCYICTHSLLTMVAESEE
eukprot:COSAG01_NODE_1108_length_11662_cov_189.275534_7_plen_102_part_00